MVKVDVFCEFADCGACDNKCCWNDCDQHCENACKELDYFKKVYSSDEFLIEQVEKRVEELDEWILGVALEKIKELLERNRKLEAEAAMLRHAAELGLNYAKKHTKHDIQTEAEDVCIDIHEILNTVNAGRAYAERVQKLEAVVEAARTCYKTYISAGEHESYYCYNMTTDYCNECGEKLTQAVVEFEKALAALEGDSNG